MKKHIPNFITCLNLFSGILGVLAAYKSDFNLALYFVLLSATFDFFDGFTARLLKVSSAIGKELDSLADLISFGFVPGMVAYMLLHPLAETCSVLPYAGFLITVFSALRLAKFNIDENQKTSFVGLATPANALFWLGLARTMPSEMVNAWIILAIVVLFSLLLVCPLPMFSLKFHSVKWTENRIRYIFLIGCVVLLACFWFNAFAIIILWYLIVSMVDFLIKLKEKRAA